MGNKGKGKGPLKSILIDEGRGPCQKLFVSFQEPRKGGALITVSFDGKVYFDRLVPKGQVWHPDVSNGQVLISLKGSQGNGPQGNIELR